MNAGAFVDSTGNADITVAGQGGPNYTFLLPMLLLEQFPKTNIILHLIGQANLLQLLLQQVQMLDLKKM